LDIENTDILRIISDLKGIEDIKDHDNDPLPSKLESQKIGLNTLSGRATIPGCSHNNQGL